MGELEASETFRLANSSQVAGGKEQTTDGRPKWYMGGVPEMRHGRGRRKIKKLQLHVKLDTAEAGSTENESTRSLTMAVGRSPRRIRPHRQRQVDLLYLCRNRQTLTPRHPAGCVHVDRYEVLIFTTTQPHNRQPGFLLIAFFLAGVISIIIGDKKGKRGKRKIASSIRSKLSTFGKFRRW